MDLRIHQPHIEALAVKKDQYPEADIPEIAFAGRSNVGKSSLINMLAGMKKLARTSSEPGKTRTINFYRLGPEFRIVDLPGYGYARISRSITSEWGKMIEPYMRDRECLVRVFLIVDIRHKPSEQDIQMYEFMKYYGLDGYVIASKADKLKRSQVAKNLKVIRDTLCLGPDDKLISVSTLKRTGREEVIQAIQDLYNESVEEVEDIDVEAVEEDITDAGDGDSAETADEADVSGEEGPEA
ncbi:MAG: ribosome biogenesis GTP-binding protein YihA/YsxC [Eubacteriales bacterium]|nr:ribosome biogenesis GTP-binding protein YihA/YsxC [Eubacteriales bacterium]